MFTVMVVNVSYLNPQFIYTIISHIHINFSFITLARTEWYWLNPAGQSAAAPERRTLMKALQSLNQASIKGVSYPLSLIQFEFDGTWKPLPVLSKWTFYSKSTLSASFCLTRKMCSFRKILAVIPLQSLALLVSWDCIVHLQESVPIYRICKWIIVCNPQLTYQTVKSVEKRRKISVHS